MNSSVGKVVAIGLVLLLAAVVPTLSVYQIELVTQMLIYAIFAMSLDILLGPLGNGREFLCQRVAERRDRIFHRDGHGGEGSPKDQAVALHSRQERRHRRLLNVRARRELLLQQRKYSEAADLFRAAYQSEPYNVTAAYNLGVALTRSGNTEEGQKMMSRFQTLRESGYGTTFSNNYMDQGRYAVALVSTGSEPDLVDRALDLSGGAAAFKRNRLEQIFRDVRMGRFHPGNTLLAHELIGKLCLGIDPDAAPRWG